MTSGLIQILIADSDVQAAVGQDVNDKYKVYPIVAPQKTDQLYVTVQKQGNDPILSKDCFSTLDTSSYELHVWSKKGFRETEVVHEICRVALETGTEVVTDACTFRKIWMTNDYDAYDKDNDMYCHVGIYTANVVRVAS